MSGLLKDMEVGDAVAVGNAIITIEAKTGRRVRLRIEAPKSVRVRTVTAGHNAQNKKPKAQEG